MRSSLVESLFARRSTAEALLLCLATAALVVWLGPSHRASPWLALVPTLIALKHGLVPGALGLAAWAGATAYVQRAVGVAFDPVAIVPQTALTLLVGQFREHWHGSRAALRAERDTQQRQLEQLFRAHGTLRASHAQLSERLSARTWSLESAVRATELQMERGDAGQAARALLELLAAHARVGAASLYASEADGTRLARRPLARLGTVPEGGVQSPLVEQAFARGSVIALAADMAARAAVAERVLLAVPLVASSGQRLGVIAVHALPFVAFHHAHFAHVALLATRLADVLGEKLVGTLARGIPDAAALPPADLPFTPLPPVKPLPHLPPLRPSEKPARPADTNTAGDAADAADDVEARPKAAADDSGIRATHDVESRTRRPTSTRDALV